MIEILVGDPVADDGTVSSARTFKWADEVWSGSPEQVIARASVRSQSEIAEDRERERLGLAPDAPTTADVLQRALALADVQDKIEDARRAREFDLRMADRAAELQARESAEREA